MKKLALVFVFFCFAGCALEEDTQYLDDQEVGMESAELVTVVPPSRPGDEVQAEGYYEWSNRSSSTCGSWQYFLINVPDNTPNLLVASFGGSWGYYYGADLYVRHIAKPTTTAYSRRSMTAYTNDETIDINNPSPGTWWIGLRANCSYTGATVIASF